MEPMKNGFKDIQSIICKKEKFKKKDEMDQKEKYCGMGFKENI